MPRQVVFHPNYSPLFQPPPEWVRYTVVTGGRGSGKTTATSTANVCDTYRDDKTVLYSRYTLVSAEVSVIPEYIDKINLLGKGRHFRATKESVVNRVSRGVLYFKGMLGSSGNQVARLKSIHKLRKFVLDEAQELMSESEFDVVDLSIRELDASNEAELILNPTDIHHWIYKRFFKKPGVPYDYNGIVDGVRYIHTDWRDNRENLHPSFIAKALECERNNPEKYANIYLGDWSIKRNGLIYPRWQPCAEADIPIGLDWWYANDWGYSNDPDALVRMAFDPLTRTLYVVEVMYETGKLPKDVAAAIREDCARIGMRVDDAFVYCDPARPDSIAELRLQYGITALPGINRDKVGRIGYLQGFKVRYCGKNIGEEAVVYSWEPSKEDEDVFTDVPQDGFDHAMDAISYGTTWLRRNQIPNDDGDIPE
jgi:phage terminase large subunit